MRRKASGPLLPYNGRASSRKKRPYAAAFTVILFVSTICFLGWTGYVFVKLTAGTPSTKAAHTDHIAVEDEPVEKSSQLTNLEDSLEDENKGNFDTKSKNGDEDEDKKEQDVPEENTAQQGQTATTAEGLYGMVATDINGRVRKLSEFAGNVTVVVNVASQCGYTDSNYKGLQELYEQYRSKGFQVLAFPCNQFGAQEPGDPQEIIDFVGTRYHVSFPLFSKVEVNGPNANNIFQFLKSELASFSQTGTGGEDINWNFNKFLVNRKGVPVKRYPPSFNKAELEADVVQLLQGKGSLTGTQAGAR